MGQGTQNISKMTSPTTYKPPTSAEAAMTERTLVGVVNQSPPIDLTIPYSDEWLRAKTILITGGASGLGEGFFRRWAAAGANVIIGDINDKRGKDLVEEVRRSTKNENLHFIHCDVTIWQSQVDMFHQAIKLSPTGGLDAVVANAGVTDPIDPPFFEPHDLSVDTPKPPNLKCLEVNLVGLICTTYLAQYYLARNPNSAIVDANAQPGPGRRDRHLLLVGSVASLGPIPGQPLYGAAKHGVLGLFRSLRSTAVVGGLRINLLCPYFIDTPLLYAGARILLAGGAMGNPSDVVEAGTRLMADTRIIGRSLVVGPKAKFSKDNEFQMVSQEDPNGEEAAMWEAYAEDFEIVEAFSERFVRLLNGIERAKGWGGWIADMAAAVTYPVRNLLGLK